MNQNERNAKLQLIISMVVFGTIGLFRKNISVPSSVLAMARGFIGALFLLSVIKLQKKKISLIALKKNLLYLILSGAFIGFNWILLFEAYNNTSIAVATLCYYMAPFIVIILSPFLLKEGLTPKKIICVIIALIGMVFVSGVMDSGIGSLNDVKGILFGLGAALFYACVIILNKKIKDISPYDKTIYQLGIAAVVLLPYTMLTEEFSNINLDLKGILLILFVGIVHTGITYYLYFGSISALKAQTVALYSFIDPIVAIIISALVLKENIGIYEIIGSFLILGSTVVCELSREKKTTKGEDK